MQRMHCTSQCWKVEIEAARSAFHQYMWQRTRDCQISQPIMRFTAECPLEQKTAFENLEDAVKSTPVLCYCNLDKELFLQCGASQSGLGAALLQNGQSVAYISRAIMLVEMWYAQMRKSCLLVISLTHMCMVTNLWSSKLITNPWSQFSQNSWHQLQSTWKCFWGSRNTVCMWIHRRAGKCTDHCSWLPVTEECWQQLNNAAADDPVQQKLWEVILQGWPESKSAVLEWGWNVHNVLTIPVVGAVLQPKYSTQKETQKPICPKRHQWYYCETLSKPLDTTSTGNTVCMKLPGQTKWSTGTCTGQVGPTIEAMRSQLRTESAGEPATLPEDVVLNEAKPSRKLSNKGSGDWWAGYIGWQRGSTTAGWCTGWSATRTWEPGDTMVDVASETCRNRDWSTSPSPSALCWYQQKPPLVHALWVPTILLLLSCSTMLHSDQCL